VRASEKVKGPRHAAAGTAPTPLAVHGNRWYTASPAGEGAGTGNRLPDTREQTMAFDGEQFITNFNTVWNGHDLEGILAMMTDDVLFEASFGTDPWGSRVAGKAAVRQFLADMFERIPDVRWDEMRHFASPELAVVEWVTTGTPRGSGRFESHGCDILGLRDGKIATKRSYRKGTV
jgi:ketosteroid isomerase-like protein